MAVQALAAPVVAAVKVTAAVAKVSVKVGMQSMRAVGQGAASAVRGMAQGASRGATASVRSVASTSKGAMRAASPNGLISQAKALPRPEPSKISSSHIRNVSKGPAKTRDKDGGAAAELLRLFLENQKVDSGRSR